MELKCVRVWLMLMLMFISFEGWTIEGCLDEERSALLQLKHFFNDPNLLLDWVEGDKNLSYCCQWTRIQCNNMTDRVISIYLSYTRKYESGEWNLNVSLFSPFQELETLYLGGNLIAGCVENEGFEKLSHLSNLEDLYLSDNMFNDSRTLSALSEHSSLKYLSLSYNQLKELNHFNVSKLNNLEYLDLSSNTFNHSIVSYVSTLYSLKELDIYDIGLKGTFDLQELVSLSNLEELYMGGNEINKIVFSKGGTSLRKLNRLYLWNVSISDGSSLLQTLGSFPSLNYVELWDCNISGRLPMQEWPSNKNLTYLEISNSVFHNYFFQLLGSITSLQTIEIWDSNLNDSLFSQGLPVFQNLTSLYIFGTIFHNNFFQMLEGMTSLQSITIENRLPVFKNLTHLDIYGIVFHINFFQLLEGITSLQSITIQDSNFDGVLLDQDFPTFKNLKYLSIYSTHLRMHGGSFLERGICNSLQLQELYIVDTDLGGNLPWCLVNLTSLEVFDISSNQFTGDISSCPLKVLTSIQDLKLSYNHFQIPISLEPFFNHSKLKAFYGENNELYVGTESQYLTPKFQLNHIILPAYGYNSSLPKFLYSQYNLLEVDLSNLNMKGEFPVWLLNNNTNLEKLYLANNSLSGPLRMPIHSHVSLKELDISINSFYGYIPTEIGAYLPMLQTLNISRNAFNGSIPSSFGDMKSLESLDFSHNLLIGQIPYQIAMHCLSLQFLVLSNNSLHGEIFPTTFNLKRLLKLQLDDNNFTGKIPDSLSKCSLEGLYISDNHLVGMLPRWLGNMSNLRDIIMSNNHFEGPIPSEFCQLENLEVLDISENNITGSLPFCFPPLSIKQVHLSRNKLQGQLSNGFSNSVSLMTLDIGYNHFGSNIPYWIDRLSELTYLILSNNNFQGEVPINLCKLDQLRLIDVSHNNLSGHIPHCLQIAVVRVASYLAPTMSLVVVLPPASAPGVAGSPASALGVAGSPASAPGVAGPPMRKEETIEFTTKNNSYFYQGRILSYMSGIDLSCNKFVGVIPYQIGNLVGIHVLNLSHNNLTGPIPSTFSNLKQIESLDLSYNNLNGKIPPQIVELNNLAVFSVAYNNLSGQTPDRIFQFGTFEEGSYEGNPLLCGQPLPKTCNALESPSLMPKASSNSEEDNNIIDMNIFYISFGVSYIIVLLAIVAVLYINPYWCHTWFYFVELCVTSCYYFIVDHLPK